MTKRAIVLALAVALAAPASAEDATSVFFLPKNGNDQQSQSLAIAFLAGAFSAVGRVIAASLSATVTGAAGIDRGATALKIDDGLTKRGANAGRYEHV